MPTLPAPITNYKPEEAQTESLFLEHSDFLMGIFTRYLPEQDAMDVYQGFCLKVMVNGFPDGIEDIRGYLYRTARNAINDFNRKATTYKKKIQEYSEHQIPKPSDNPAKKVSQFNMLLKAFERIEKNLSPSVNQVFVQKYQQNLDHHEIADKMKIEKGTVDRYLSVGTKKIQELYDQFFGDFDE